MSKKHTIEFIRGQFEKEGYTFSSEEYVNSKTLLKYVCPEGHNGTITWNGWQHGYRCKVCGELSSANKHRLSVKFIREQFKKEGYILLTKEYVNNKQKLEYICPKGHKGGICWGSWNRGHRCLACSGLKKLTIDFIRNSFEKEGYVLLTREYINCYQKLEYICPSGHFGKITRSNWNQGYRCKECYLENNKGSNNSNWNPNLTDEDRVNGRRTLGYEEWPYKVKERDCFTCQVCGDNKGGNLISHHLESYNNNPDLRTALDNGVCLCEKCHKNFHHQYGYGNNTREQFEEFIGVEA